MSLCSDAMHVLRVGGLLRDDGRLAALCGVNAKGLFAHLPIFFEGGDAIPLAHGLARARDVPVAAPVLDERGSLQLGVLREGLEEELVGVEHHKDCVVGDVHILQPVREAVGAVLLGIALAIAVPLEAAPLVRVHGRHEVRSEAVGGLVDAQHALPRGLVLALGDDAREVAALTNQPRGAHQHDRLPVLKEQGGREVGRRGGRHGR